MIYVVADRVGMLACEVEERVTARELMEWQAYFKLEAEAHKRARLEAESKIKRR